jgi:predicted DNA-binding transcriptional regulator YafY
MSGKTPARLVEALIIHPVVSSRMLAEEGGVSSASAGRALALFEEIGLTKEITGGGRFRFWRAI